MSVYIGGTKVAGLEKELPAQAGNAGKYLYTNGQNASWEEASTAQIWIGTQEEYEALGTYDPEVVYQVTDDFQNLIPNVGQITEDVNDLKAHAVVEFQPPTAENNYTWYRLYADGWVEQGGVLTATGSSSEVQQVLMIPMADTNFSIQTSAVGNGFVAALTTRTTTLVGFVGLVANVGYFSGYFYWEVKGMAA